jgi:hypothetical protein
MKFSFVSLQKRNQNKGYESKGNSNIEQNSY